jgi:N-acyl-D-amino-acid deacylase
MRTLAAGLTLLLLAAPVWGDPVRTAVEKGLRRIEQGAANYPTHRQCFSCHHQAMSLLSLTAARRHGLRVAPEKIQRQVEFTLKTFAPNRDQIRKGHGIPGANTTAAYALWALEAGGHAADETTSALVEYLLQNQRRDGSWPATTNRPPTEGSSFTNNALALHDLLVYGPATDAKGADALRRRIDQAVTRGRGWLLANKPETTEDQVFRLRGLVWSGAGSKEIRSARDVMVREQRSDGSWAQLRDRDGDAYATGSVLVALRSAGLSCDDAGYQRGVKYLLASQKADGSWLVTTRSRPVQVFFDNGDPGGKSQFISFVATNWAVLALLETLPASGPKDAGRRDALAGVPGPQVASWVAGGGGCHVLPLAVTLAVIGTGRNT